jgi:DNA-binding winged helix-turn-helix (wHTH) protein
VFEDCALDVDRWELRRAGRLIHVQRKPWEVLLYLIWHRHRMVSADELLEKLWPDSKVTMASVSAAIRDVRRAIGDDGRAQRMIVTRKGVGFRFVAEIEGPRNLAAAG